MIDDGIFGMTVMICEYSCYMSWWVWEVRAFVHGVCNF